MILYFRQTGRQTLSTKQSKVAELGITWYYLVLVASKLRHNAKRVKSDLNK